MTTMPIDYERTYSMVEIAAKLGRPRTTVQEWARLFNEFLPTVGHGRMMRYKEECLETFALIARLKEEGQPNEYIKDILRGFVQEVTVTTNNDDEPFLERIVKGYATLYEEMQRQNEDLKKRIEELERRMTSEIAASREQIEPLARVIEERDEKLMQLLREIQESKKSFWKRLFGR
jgi:DNA-binding transcriptional MerR regulator